MIIKTIAKTLRAGGLAIMLLLAGLSATAGDYARHYEGLPVALSEPQAPTIPANTVSIKDFGGVPDGTTLNTEAFAKAMKALEKKGGGHLLVPAGLWLSGPIQLKNGIDLHLERGALLLFSPDKTLYLKDGKVQSCISASKRHDISITGEGIIDGNGAWWRAVKRGKVSDVEWADYHRLGGTELDGGKLWYPFDLKDQQNIAPDPAAQEKMRTHMIRLTDCERVLIKGVTIQNSPKFHLIPTRCSNVIIDGVTLRCPWNAQNGDGIDITCCQDVLVLGCNVDVGDDGICLKAGGGAAALKYPPVARVLIKDNTVFHGHGGFVIGSEFTAGVQDVVVKNNVFSGTDTGLRFKSAPGRGGRTSNIYIEDIVMSGIRDQAIIFETGYVDVPVGTVGKAEQTQEFQPEFTDIHISRVVCRGARVGIAAKGSSATVHGVLVGDSIFQDVGTAAEIADPAMIDFR